MESFSQRRDTKAHPGILLLPFFYCRVGCFVGWLVGWVVESSRVSLTRHVAGNRVKEMDGKCSCWIVFSLVFCRCGGGGSGEEEQGY